MKPYPIAIPAGKEYVEQFGAGANYIRLDEGATVSVTVKSYVNDDEYILQPGDDVTFSPFSELAISHNGSALTAFILYVGRGTKANSPRIGGTVQVTSGSNNKASPPLSRQRAETQEGNVYVAIGLHNTAITWPAVQLFNPAGSGVNLIISRFGIAFGTPFPAYMYRDAAPRGIADTKPVYNKLGVIADGTNKGAIYLADEAALRSPTLDIFGGASSLLGNLLPEIGVVSNIYCIGGKRTDSQYPYILTPGSGIQLLILASGANVYYLAEWQEVAP